MVLSQHLPKKWRVDLPESKDLVSASSWAVWPWASPSASFFFFFLIFTTTKMSLGLDLRTSFICGLLPRTGGPVCSTVWEGSDVAFSSVEKRAMTCYHWLKFKNMGGGVSDTASHGQDAFFFFFLIFIYFWLHWVLVATCRTFPCSVWALWLWLVGSRVPGLSSRPA